MNKPSAPGPAKLSLAFAVVCFAATCPLPNASAAPYLDGFVLREVWTNVAGPLGLPPLTNRADFPSQPALTTYESNFEAPNQFGDNYGQRLSGLLRPRVSGSYIFYISSDDQSELYLSPDATPEKRRLIAIEPQWSPPRTWVGDGFGRQNNDNQSEPIYLEAGKTYYLEALHREGGGGDNIGVTWRLAQEQEPANGTPAIPGEFFVSNNEPPDPDLPDLQFQLSFYAGTVDTPGSIYHRNYTLRGPVAGKLLPDMRVVSDNQRLVYFAANPHVALRIDPRTGAATSIQPAAPLPEMSWPMGMTFDSQRSKAYLVTLGGEGYLYSYSAPDNHWSLVSSLHERDLDCITYHPGLDALFGFEVYRGSYAKPRLLRYDLSGTQTDAIELPPLPFDVGVSAYQSELVAVSSYLVLLIGRAPGWHQPGQPAEARIYLIDPQTKQARLTYRALEEDATNQAPTVAMQHPISGSWFEQGKTVPLRAEAVDPDGAVVKVEFFDGNTRLGQADASPDGKTYAFNWTGAPLGGHEVSARATDNRGSQTHSSQITVLILSPPTIAPASGDQDRAAVASDGCGFLVAWQDRRNYGYAGSTDYDIYGSRVSASGQVLDPGGLKICVKEARQENPSVAFDGTNYLVVWEEHLSNNAGSFIWARRVTRSGELLDGPHGFVVSQGNWLESNARVAWNGSAYLAVWTDWRHYTESISDIYGARITPGGAVLDASGIKICQAPMWQTWPVVAAREGHFFVVWSDMNSLKATFVDGSGTVLNPSGLAIAQIDGEGQPAVAAGANGFLVSWHEARVLQTEPPIYDSALIAQQVRANGELLQPSLRLSGPDHNANHSAIAPVGHLYRVVWANQGASSYQIETVLTPTTMMPTRVNAGRQPRSWPSIAYNGTNFLVAWTDRRHMPPEMSSLGDGDIYAALLKTAPLDTNGFLVSSSMKRLPMVTWPKPADIVYGTTLGAAQLNATADVPGSFVYSPSAGVQLPAGQDQVLGAVFQPADRDAYAEATVSTTINVRPASLTIRADDKSRIYGVANPPLTASFFGFVNGETSSSLDAPPQLSTAAAVNSPPGLYPIMVSSARDANYTITHVNGTLTVLPGTTNRSWAQDLSFDPTSQQHLTGLEGRFGSVSSMALQADGKLVIGGRFIGVNGLPVRHVARLNANGTVDPSFNSRFGPDDGVSVVSVQQDGAVLFGGHFQNVNGEQQPFLARLKPDGALDPAFSPQVDGAVHFIAQQRDGRIIIGGEFKNVDGESRWQVARLQTDGGLDRSFVPEALGSPTGWNPVMGVALAANEKVLVGRAGCDARDALRRLNSDGKTDLTFDFRPGAIQCAGVRRLSLLPDGRIYVLGSFGELPNRRPRQLIRLLPDGLLDVSFDQTTLNFDAQSILARPDSKLVIGGHRSSLPGDFSNGLARFNADGSIDTTFQVPDSVLGQRGGVQSIVARADGRLLIGRNIGSDDEPSRKAVAQLLPNGAIDPSFEMQLNSPGAMVQAILPVGEGRFIVGGSFYYHNNTPREALARLNRSGTLDPTFSAPRGFASVNALARQSDGRILAGGSLLVLNSAGIYHPVVRLQPNGAVDPSFNAALPSEGMIIALALQADGKVLAGGNIVFRDDGLGCLARLLPDGRLDPSFVQGMGIGGEDRIVRALAVQPDGRILVGGYFENYDGTPCSGLIRLMPDGALDPTFGNEEEIVDASKIEVLPGGKVLILGNGEIIRLLPDGARDPGFAPPEFPNTYLSAFARLPDGRIVVSGQRTEPAGPDHELIAVLYENGALEAYVPWDMIGWDYVATLEAVSSTELLVGGYFHEVNGMPSCSIGRIARSETNRPSSFTRSLPDSAEGSLVTINAVPGAQAETYAVQDRPPTGWAVRDISHSGVWDSVNQKVKYGPFFDNETRMLTYRVTPPHQALGLFHFEGQGSVDGVAVPIVGDSRWTIPTFHPADFSPIDWRMTIDEMTAYASIWRGSVTNSKYPQVIPMSYVTRAAALWKGGEVYRYDPNAGVPPLCWVNTHQRSPVAKADAEAPAKVVRRAPALFVPGQLVRVTLETQPRPGTQAFAVEELLPTGWSPRGISHGGTFVVAHQAIRWGPFLDDEPRVLSCELVPGQHARGQFEFRGAGSFDGLDCPAEGQLRTSDGSGLAWKGGDGRNGPMLQIRGWPGDVFLIERSVDLETWSRAGVVTNAGTAVEIPIAAPDVERQMFYRASLILQ